MAEIGDILAMKSAQIVIAIHHASVRRPDPRFQRNYNSYSNKPTFYTLSLRADLPV